MLKRTMRTTLFLKGCCVATVVVAVKEVEDEDTRIINPKQSYTTNHHLHFAFIVILELFSWIMGELESLLAHKVH